MIENNTVEAKKDGSKPVWTAPVIDIFDAKDAEAGVSAPGEGIGTS